MMLTSGEAAKVLNMSPGGARNILGEASGSRRLPTGVMAQVWPEEHVIALRRERDLAGIVPRKRLSDEQEIVPEYQPGKSGEFDIDRNGRMIPPKRRYGGRTCRSKRCKEPVETGKLYCDKHKHIFDSMKKRSDAQTTFYPCEVIK